MVDDTRDGKAPRKMRIKNSQTRAVRSNAEPAADLNKIVAENVYNIRRTLNLTQEKMAARTGMTLAALGSLERGQKNITLASMAQIAASYGVDPHALICGPEYGVDSGGGLALDTLARMTHSIDARVQALLVKHGPVSISQAHLASILGALFDALGNAEPFQPRQAKPRPDRASKAADDGGSDGASRA